jgi:hypothetical protein
VIQLAADGAQAGFDIAQAFAVSELSERHRQMVPAREASKVSIPSIARQTLLKLVGRQVIHELSEDGSAEIHATFFGEGRPCLAARFCLQIRLENFKLRNLGPPLAC